MTICAEPGPQGRRPIGMTALAPPRTISPARRTFAAWAGALTAGTCLLAAGCSAGSQTASSASGAGAAAAHRPANDGAVAGPAAPAPRRAAGSSASGGSQARQSLSLTALGPPGQSIIYTAGLTLRDVNVQVWVDDQQRLSRLTLLLSEDNAMNVSQTVDYIEWGAPVTIAAPPANQVTEQ